MSKDAAAFIQPQIPAPPRILLTVAQLIQQQPALSAGGVRWDLFNRERNGLAKSGAIFRRGRRVLIDPVLYLAWMEDQSRSP